MARPPSLKLVQATHALPEAGQESVRTALALAESFYRDAVLASRERALDHARGTMGIVS